MIYVFRHIRFCLSVGFLILAAQPALAWQQVDVQRDIWPLLRQHCVDCHDLPDAEGGLRLTRKSLIEKGGHTGNVILGSLDDSELLRRLRSDDPLYRMPKDTEPLAPEEIDRFENWIDQGAPWPNDQSIAPTRSVRRNDAAQWRAAALKRASELHEALAVLGYPALALMFLFLLFERRKRHVKDSRKESLGFFDRAASQFRLIHYWMAMLILALVAMWRIHRADVARLELENSNYLAVLDEYHISGAGKIKNTSRDQKPLIPRHPPRLGGTYYRGNDERNPKLFNGGYYRTATMNLSLRDKESNQLAWNDSVQSDELTVCLEIERAPFATPGLFRDEVMQRCLLTRRRGMRGNEEAPGVEVALEVVQPGERWKACFPIASPNLRGTERWNGLVYVCDSSRQAHYGIEYDVQLRDGIVSNDSRLSMGATFRPVHVMQPPVGILSAHEWFSFLPLPEIVGGNTADPTLLGIPEHEARWEEAEKKELEE